MEIRNSFCVNYYKALTIRFVRELQSVLRFLASNLFALISSFLFLYIIMYLDYLLIIFVKLLLMLVE